MLRSLAFFCQGYNHNRDYPMDGFCPLVVRTRAKLGLLLIVLLYVVLPPSVRVSSAQQTTASDHFALDLVFEIGEDEADFFFGKITALEADSRGLLYVADFLNHSIEIFNPTGTHARTIGGVAGQGPGEFSGYIDLSIGPADTLYAFDRRLNRFSIFDKDYQLQPTVFASQAHARYPSRALTDRHGGFYVIYIQAHHAGNLDSELYDIVGRINREGKKDPGFALQTKSRQGLTIRFDGGGFMASSTPFAARPVMKTLPDGTLIGGYNSQLRIDKFSASGDTISFIDHVVERKRIGKSAIDAFLNSLRDGALSHLDSGVEKYLDRARKKLPTRWPAFDDLAVDNQGRVWVTINAQGEEGGELMLFNDKGEFVSRSDLDPGVIIHVVKGGYAYGVRTRENGLETVVKYRVVET